MWGGWAWHHPFFVEEIFLAEAFFEDSNVGGADAAAATNHLDAGVYPALGCVCVCLGRDHVDKLPVGHDKFAGVGVDPHGARPIFFEHGQRRPNIFGEGVHDGDEGRVGYRERLERLVEISTTIVGIHKPYPLIFVNAGAKANPHRQARTLGRVEPYGRLLNIAHHLHHKKIDTLLSQYVGLVIKVGLCYFLRRLSLRKGSGRE